MWNITNLITDKLRRIVGDVVPPDAGEGCDSDGISERERGLCWSQLKNLSDSTLSSSPRDSDTGTEHGTAEDSTSLALARPCEKSQARSSHTIFNSRVSHLCVDAENRETLKRTPRITSNRPQSWIRWVNHQIRPCRLVEVTRVIRHPYGESDDAVNIV